MRTLSSAQLLLAGGILLLSGVIAGLAIPRARYALAEYSGAPIRLDTYTGELVPCSRSIVTDSNADEVYTYACAEPVRIGRGAQVWTRPLPMDPASSDSAIEEAWKKDRAEANKR